MATQSPSTSSSLSYGFTYHVFLNFRGPDTRYGFSGNLYKALIDKGIHTFIDDFDLQRGVEITQSLIKAIEESWICIPVFSVNYASSSFCLDELVHIMHVHKTKGRLVLPVFYGVDPTCVRHQLGNYSDDLINHEKRFRNNKENMERLEKWKMAMKQAAYLSGFHFRHGYGYEHKFIEKIVKYISNKIDRGSLLGLQSQVQQVNLPLDKGSDDWLHTYEFIGDQFKFKYRTHVLILIAILLACLALNFGLATSTFFLLYRFFPCSGRKVIL